jgi:K+/H+ antiporter YhaU regulatory subunit KhtT
MTDQNIPAPDPNEVLRGGDRLVVVGRQENFAAFRDMVES